MASSSPLLMQTREFPEARQGGRCEALPGLVVWLFGWYGFVTLAATGRPTPYVCACALAVHVRILAPLGQLVPLPDPLICYVGAASPAVLLGAIWEAYHRHRAGDRSGLLWCAVAAVMAGLAAGRHCAAYEGLRARLARSAGRVRRPRRPLLTWLHPYVYRCCWRLPGGVRIVRVPAGEGLGACLDVWALEDEEASALTEGAGRPIFLLVHGGGWRGGGASLSPQAPVLHALAAAGWVVVSCGYRKDRWPHHADDALSALQWVCGQEAATRFGAAAARGVVLAGASAGGHIACTVLPRAAALGIHVHAMILFYPALDPGDRAGATARFPLCCWPLKIQRGQSLLSWFFERVVLRGSTELWPSAEPLLRLSADWPRTMIVHGDADSVVPLEHSRHFLARLATLAPERAREDALLEMPGCRHSFEIAPGPMVELSYDAALRFAEGARR